MRQNSRFSDGRSSPSLNVVEQETPSLLFGLNSLKSKLIRFVSNNNDGDNVFYDQKVFAVLDILDPFLNVIRSEETSGPITGVALNSVKRFLDYFASPFLVVPPDNDAGSPRDDSLSVSSDVLEVIAQTVMCCKFEATDPDIDEVVLMKILQVLLSCLQAPQGSHLSDEITCELCKNVFTMSTQPRLSELLRKTANSTLSQMFLTVSRRFGSDPFPSSHLPRVDCMRRLLEFLTHSVITSPVQCLLGLELFSTILDMCGKSLSSFPQLLECVRKSVSLSLFRCLQTTHLTKLVATLRIFHQLFYHMKGTLKVHLSIFLNSIPHLYRWMEDQESSSERKEAILHSVIEYCRDPFFATQLYVNFDCDISQPDVFHNFCQFLGNCALGEGTHYSGSISGKKPGLHPSTGASSPSRPSHLSPSSSPAPPSTSPPPPMLKTQVLALEALVALLNGLSSGGLDQVTSNCVGEIDDEAVIESLLVQRKQKLRIEHAVRLFNSKEFQECFELLHKDSESEDGREPGSTDNSENTEPISPLTVVAFLRNARGLDPTVVGDFLGKNKPLNTEILEAFVSSFDFPSDEKFSESFRKFLESFRIPGESPVISRILEVFAKHYVTSNGILRQPFANADAVEILAYSTLMLNVDQHNPEVKVRMTESDFVKNNKGINDKQDLPKDLLVSIYHDIKSHEVYILDFPDDFRGYPQHRSHSQSNFQQFHPPYVQQPTTKSRRQFCVPPHFSDQSWRKLLEKSVASESENNLSPFCSASYHKLLLPVLWQPLLTSLERAFLSSVIVISSSSTNSSSPSSTAIESMESHLGVATVPSLVSSFEHISAIAAFSQITGLVDRVVVNMCKFSSLLSPQTSSSSFCRNLKGRVAAGLAFRVVRNHYNHLTDQGWKHAIATIINARQLNLLPQLTNKRTTLIVDSIDEVPLQPHEPETPNRGNSLLQSFGLSWWSGSSPSHEPSPPSEDSEPLISVFHEIEDFESDHGVHFLSSAEGISRKSVETCLLEVFSQSDFHQDSFICLVKSLMVASQKPGKIVHQSIASFSLDILAQLLLLNSRNPTIELIWDQLRSHFLGISLGKNPSGHPPGRHQLRAISQTLSICISVFTGSTNDLHVPREKWLEILQSLVDGMYNDVIIERVYCGRLGRAFRLLCDSDPVLLAGTPEGRKLVFSFAKSLCFTKGKEAIEALKVLFDKAHLNQIDSYSSQVTFEDWCAILELFFHEKCSVESTVLAMEIAYQQYERVVTAWKMMDQEECGEAAGILGEAGGWSMSLLKRLISLCRDPRRDVRNYAMTHVQRALLSPAVSGNVGTGLAADRLGWVKCLEDVVFPLLRDLLQPSASSWMEREALEETRLRACVLLSKVFLRYLPQLSQLEHFEVVWLDVLRFLEMYMKVSSRGGPGGELLAEGVSESLKNILLVMSESGHFEPDTDFWRLTWSTIDGFCSSLRSEFDHILAKDDEQQPDRRDSQLPVPPSPDPHLSDSPTVEHIEANPPPENEETEQENGDSPEGQIDSPIQIKKGEPDEDTRLTHSETVVT